MKDFQRGLSAALPLLPGVAAFGLLFGMMARQAGFTALEASTMSVTVFAGSAQFTALGMWSSTGATPIILTTLVLNLRHMLMGASVAPYLTRQSWPWKAGLALWLTDESYALAMAAYERGLGGPWFFLGANSGIFFPWQVSTLAGALLSAAIPDPSRYGLDLVFPLGFLGLMTAFLKDRASLGAALLAGGAALAGLYLLPGKWYVIAAGLLGSAAGLLLEELEKQRERG